MSELETMVKHYIAALLFSENDESGDPLDSNHATGDLTRDARKKITDDCKLFLSMARELLDEAQSNTAFTDFTAQVGHDFLLTRNGHGVGFWESEWGQWGERLTEIAQRFHEMDAYVSRRKINVEYSGLKTKYQTKDK